MKDSLVKAEVMFECQSCRLCVAAEPNMVLMTYLSTAYDPVWCGPN